MNGSKTMPYLPDEDRRMNPYQSPVAAPIDRIHAARSRRRWINNGLTVVIAVVLFVAYWGIKFLLGHFNNWVLQRNR
jgi:hypothetical protein